MNYFNEKNNKGYEYAYMYPGMNKVLQAAGRVIRSEKDRGAILLIDDRFVSRSYVNLFPKEWMNNIIVRKSEDVENVLDQFWRA
jgi:DNA excision repair protein ERCC-2